MFVRPVAQKMFDACILDVWPDGMAALVDFGLDGWGAEDRNEARQSRYEALHGPIRAGELTVEQLNEALGNGPKLTALVNACPSNPHKGIKFVTCYDDMGGDEEGEDE